MTQKKKSKEQFMIHTNPDGTTGGRVSVDAHIGNDVTIPEGALVIGSVEIPDGTKIKEGQFVFPSGTFSFTV